jgi:hypothetical protein
MGVQWQVYHVGTTCTSSVACAGHWRQSSWSWAKSLLGQEALWMSKIVWGALPSLIMLFNDELQDSQLCELRWDAILWAYDGSISLGSNILSAILYDQWTFSEGKSRGLLTQPWQKTECCGWFFQMHEGVSRIEANLDPYERHYEGKINRELCKLHMVV